MSADISVSNLTQQCLDKLHEATTGKNDTEHQNHLENRLAGFNLWVDNVGALARSGASLDSRFRSRPDDLDLVRNILRFLSDVLDDYKDTVHNGLPIAEALVNIDSAIRNLAMIGVAIRRTGKASRSRRANQSFNPDDHHEFKRHLECLILLRPSKDQPQPDEREMPHLNEPIDSISSAALSEVGVLKTKLEQPAKSRMDELDSSRLNEIQKRLIDANLRRRHNFLLAQKRSQRVKKTTQTKLAANKKHSDAAALISSEISLTTHDSVKAKIPASLRPKDRPAKSKAAPTVTGYTIASTAEGTFQFHQARNQQRTPTVAGSQISFIAANTEFPKPPSSSRDQLVFKCPCCCQSLPSEDFTTSNRWKQHLIEDLCPYTCIAESCPTPDLLFTTRKAWELHIENDHTPQWQCLLCEEDDELFLSEADLTAHTQIQHTEALLTYELSFLLSSAEVRYMGIESCPLCPSYGPRDSPELVDHAVRHAYEFALRALPWPQSVEEDLNKPIGTYSLQQNVPNTELFEKWLNAVQCYTKQLAISPFDIMAHTLQGNEDGTSAEDYFANNDYFEDEESADCSKRQTAQTPSSRVWSESSGGDLASQNNVEQAACEAEEQTAWEAEQAARKGAAIAKEEEELALLLKKRTTTIGGKLSYQTEGWPGKLQASANVQDEPKSKVSPTSEVTHITLEYYLEYISNERLRRMPVRGSAWDRVLHAAKFFGLHISDFGDKINTFLNGELPNTLSQEVRADDLSGQGSGKEVLLNGQNNHASSINGAIDLITTALTTAHSLLEIGYTQAETLLPTFSALYEISVLYTDIIRVYNLEQPSHETPSAAMSAAIQAFHSIIVFLNDMRTLYEQKINNAKPGSSKSLEFGPDFRAKVEQIWRFKETLSNEIWKEKLEAAGLSTNVNLLQSKLQLNKSHYVPNGLFEKIGHYANTSTEVGYWLKNILSDDNTGQIVCITGEESCGKTFLAGWIEERLARPIHVKSNHVLRYDFPCDLPSQPTPDGFLKSILYRILKENVGNIDVYKSIAQAFEQQSGEADSEPTELVLWDALHASLKAIHIQHASIIMILDGCEGIAGGDAEFYQNLRTCIHELSNVRIVTFSRSIPDNVREHEHAIPSMKVEKDIETYFFEILSQSYAFNSLSSAERKELIKTIMAKANNNWLWSFCASQLLSKEQSKASLLQTSLDMESDILPKVMRPLEFDKRNSSINHA